MILTYQKLKVILKDKLLNLLVQYLIFVMFKKIYSICSISYNSNSIINSLLKIQIKKNYRMQTKKKY